MTIKCVYTISLMKLYMGNYLLFLSAASFQGYTQLILLLHLTLFPASSSVSPTLCMSFFTSSMWSSSFLPAWQLHLWHTLSSTSTIPPLLTPKPSQSCLSNFTSKTVNLNCPSDIFICNLVHPAHSQ